MFSLIYAWINDWVNNREAGDLRRQHGHYDVIVMKPTYGFDITKFPRTLLNLILWKLIKRPQFFFKWPIESRKTSGTSRVKTMKPRQNGHHFADDIFKCIFLNEYLYNLIQISLKFDPGIQLTINQNSFGWLLGAGKKPLSESKLDLVHYNDVIMSAMAYQSPAYRLLTQPFVQAQIKENIKAPRHWPLWGESTGNRWIPRAKGQ